MYKNILIATDGSELADQGIKQGIALAKELGARVTFVSVTELLPSYGIVVAAEWASSPTAFAEYHDAIFAAAQEILHKAKTAANAAHVENAAIHVENQSPALGILEAAAKRNCDLIVIASHGRRGVNKILLGSQAAEIISRSDIPVLVIK